MKNIRQTAEITKTHHFDSILSLHLFPCDSIFMNTSYSSAENLPS